MHLFRLLLPSLLALSAVQAPAPSALISDPKGWVDLLADKTLQNWTRVPQGAVGKLPAGLATDPSPWKLDPSGDVLVCEGDKAGHEMFRFAEEQGDFVLHVEWRFTKLEGDPPYNSGVYARTSADGAIWFQAQTGAAGGYLFGNAPVSGKPQRVNLREKMTENRVKPAGEWNVYEIRAAGKSLTLWVNGAVVNEYTECEVPRGFVGLEAEGYRIEFRNL
ncbi:MAG: DUF1080 domain-containing protein, partial [Acidobacteria bacterium]|nr:DUF1080 domain-containing protein [Acidobacteriota bacterium]